MELKSKIQLFHVLAAFLFGLSCYWTVHGKESTDIIAIDTPEGDVTIETEEEHEEITGVFQPTDQWQIVKPGEAIPTGLHVRIDLSTGVKEAKLMDEDSTEGADEGTGEGGVDADHMVYWKEGDRAGIQHNKQKYFTYDEIKKAMKLFRANQDDVQDQEAKKKLQEKFRSLEELKRDFEAMDLNIETDLQVMRKLLDRYNRSEATVEEKVTALHELEYYVHQIDNAKDLVTVGGLKLVLYALNSTEDRITLEAAYVLGSAVQSNPHVQVQAVDSGALQLLLQTLGTSKFIPLRRKAMYATSSLLRMFPYAQERFLELGGLNTFTGLFQETDPAAVTLKVKAVTLLHDLLVEKSNTIEFDDPEDKVHQMRKQQYARVDLLSGMLDQGWCELVPSLLEVPDNDTQEKVLHAMAFLMEPCQHFSRDLSVIHKLTAMRKNLNNLIRSEESGSEDSYFNELVSLVNSILGHIVS